MKCLAVFSSLPDLSYLWTDHEFKNHLCKTAVKCGLMDPSSNLSSVDEEMILSYAGHFFSPLVTSNKYMREVNNSYQTMICDNGFIICMNQFQEISELYFVALCGDGEDSELFLQRKISFFHRTLLFIFGPCAVDHLKPPYPQKRKQTWRMLNKWIVTWHTLCQQEQMYLVESLERLHVNQELNSVSLHLLGEVLSRSNKDGNTMHTLLLVNNKLLGLYSSERAIELRASDILLLIVLMKKRFGYMDELVPRSVYRTPPPFCYNKNLLIKDDRSLFKSNSKKNVSMPVDIVADQDDRDSTSSSKFHSAPSTPSGPSSSNDTEDFYTPRVSTIKVDEEGDDVDENGSLPFDLTMNEADLEVLCNSLSNQQLSSTPSEKHQFEDDDEEGDENAQIDFNEEEENENESTLDPDESKKDEHDNSQEYQDISQQNQDASQQPSTPTNTKDEEDIPPADIFHENIFLQADDGSYAPFTAHCVLLSNATVLVMLSQHRQMFLAFIIQNLLRCLNSMLNLNKHKLLSYRQMLLEDCEKLIRKIQTFFFRNSAAQTNKMAQCFKNFEQSWKLTQNAGLASFINSDTISVEMSTRLETGITSLLNNIKHIFTHLFIFTTRRHQAFLEKQNKIVSVVREIAVRRLSHYDLFLNVRGQQNVTMTAYHNDYPGLVHFIYINRTTDQLTAPTVNVNRDSNNSMYILIKQRIWDFWQYSEVMVSNGYSAFIVRDGDFCYSYFIWFEDMLGKPMVSQKSLKDLNENKPTGILSGHFYKNVIHYMFPTEPKGRINCYEMLTMHVGVVSNQFIAASCKKLTRTLWEGCAEANLPTNLL